MVDSLTQISAYRGFRRSSEMLLAFVFIIAAVSGGENDWKSAIKDPTWQQIIAQGGMHIRKTRSNTPESPENKIMYPGNQPCTQPNGKPGICMPMKHCLQEEFQNDLNKFKNYLCIIKQTSIGVCCSDNSEKFGPELLAGDLPATAPREEDNEVVLKIERAENRGCGVSTRPQGRVMGARPANVREWPWMAFIIPTGFEQHCGGVLITDRHVMTAAHCTRRFDADELEVRLGEYDYKLSNESRSYNFKVIEKRQHDGFDHSTFKNDIAILKLHRSVVFNTYVWPICLPPFGLDLVNETAVVIGWGTKFYGGPNSNVLMEVSVPIWSHQKCVDSFTDSIFDETMCAGGYSGGKDACQGDSGGPLMYQMPSGRWTSIGIVSWGVRCGEPNHPGLYLQVEKYLQWIVENTQF